MDIFDIEGIMDFIDPITTTTDVEKVRITAFSDDYYEWIKPATDSKESIAMVEEAEYEHECQCGSCQGTGTWVGPKWSRPCLTCGGTGRIDAKRAKHNEVYQAVKGTSAQRKTYKDFKNPVFHAIAA